MDIDLWGDLTDSMMFAQLRLGGLQPDVKCQDLTPQTRWLGGTTGWQELVFSIYAVYSKLQPAWTPRWTARPEPR